MATYVELIIGDLPGFDPQTTKAVTFKGQLDESNVDEQAKKIYQVLDTSAANFTLILNFAELEYMNSKAIGYLTDWYTRLTDKQGKILIVQPRENILDILQVVGLTQLIQTYATMDEARLALNQNSPKPVSQPSSEAPSIVMPVQAPQSPNVITQIASSPAPAPMPTPAPVPDKPAGQA